MSFPIVPRSTHFFCAVLSSPWVYTDGMKQERDNIYFLPSGNGVCVEDCPSETNYTKFICYDEVYPEILNNETGEVRVETPHLEPCVLSSHVHMYNLKKA